MNKLTSEKLKFFESKGIENEELKKSLALEREKFSELDKRFSEQGAKVLHLTNQLHSLQTAEELWKFVETKVSSIESDSMKFRSAELEKELSQLKIKFE